MECKGSEEELQLEPSEKSGLKGYCLLGCSFFQDHMLDPCNIAKRHDGLRYGNMFAACSKSPVRVCCRRQLMYRNCGCRGA